MIGFHLIINKLYSSYLSLTNSVAQSFFSLSCVLLHPVVCSVASAVYTRFHKVRHYAVRCGLHRYMDLVVK